MPDRNVSQTTRPGALALALLTCVALYGFADDQSDAAALKEHKEALSPFNDLVGGWRGTGQVRRGSAQGAWREDGEWIWEFTDDGVAIRYDVTDGEHLKTGRLTFDSATKEFVLVATLPDDAERTYRGKLEDDRLTLTSTADDAGEVHRITVTLLNEKRTLVLFEKRRESQQSFQRVAEVGYTREGTRLAFKDGTGPECVVTGGAGTISVTHKGQTYYVCCTGCQQAFEDDPEGVLAEYAARLEKERLEREAAE
jgi:YHS domain-containing protein